MPYKRMLLSLLFLVSLSNLQSQSLTEIMEMHYKAINQEALSAANNLHIVSTINRLSQSIKVEIWQERPHKMRMEVLSNGEKIIQVFDGEKGYVVSPMYGITDAQEVTGPQLLALASQADMDGDLFQWKEKGYSLELEGIEEFENTTVFILQLISEEGAIKRYYLDGESYLPIKMADSYIENNKRVEAETYFKDYQVFEDIKMATIKENMLNGFKSNTIKIQKIEFDIELPKDIFLKPVKQ